MAPMWRFLEARPDDVMRDPIGREYFSEESVEQPVSGLVREAIQNSLDARLNSQPATVRIALSDASAAVGASRMRPWMDGLWPHLRAEQSGLWDIPDAREPCNVLIIEDFGTTGLEGAIDEWPVKPGRENRFFAFFRAEGISSKLREQGGRWGVGKTVFPRSSRINTFFGLTIRASDGRRILMGQSILRHHHVEDALFTPYGIFGEEGAPVPPVEDPLILDSFADNFDLKRRREAGLSVVVPYPDPDITGEGIIRSTVEEYFFPILSGALEVVVEDPSLPDGKLSLSQETLTTALLETVKLHGLAGVIELSRWYLADGHQQPIALKSTTDDLQPTWQSMEIPDVDELRLRFLEGIPLTFRVPLQVTPREGTPSASFFDIAMRRDLTGQGFRPLFIRSSIIVPEARHNRLSGPRVFALTVISDLPLAAMLGDAETPAHTNWSHTTGNFKGRYRYGRDVIAFVKQAPQQILTLLTQQRGKLDRTTLAEVFPRPASVGPAGGGPGGPRPGPDTPRPRPPSPESTDPFDIREVNGGFSIVAAKEAASLIGKQIHIQVAYDIPAGNPLSRYNQADFRLQELTVKENGAVVSPCSDNFMVVTVHSDEFSIEVRGFDPNRDLFIRARARQ